MRSDARPHALFAALAALAGLLAFPVAAPATLEVRDSLKAEILSPGFELVDESTARNDVSIKFDRGSYLIKERGSGVELKVVSGGNRESGCKQVGRATARCTPTRADLRRARQTSAYVGLGPGDDRLLATSSGPLSVSYWLGQGNDFLNLRALTAAWADMGSGNDVAVVSGPSSVSAHGGSGNDQITSRSFPEDQLYSLDGGAGADRLTGGAGQELLAAGRVTIKRIQVPDFEVDTIAGGDGRDSVTAIRGQDLVDLRDSKRDDASYCDSFGPFNNLLLDSVDAREVGGPGNSSCGRRIR